MNFSEHSSLWVFQDITELRGIEKALFESEDQLKLALEGTHDGLWNWNIQTGEACFSPRWFTIW